MVRASSRKSFAAIPDFDSAHSGVLATPSASPSTYEMNCFAP